MSNLRHGWYWGKQAFGEKMAAVAEGVVKLRRNRNYRSAPIHQRHDEREAERIVREGVVRWDLSETELEELPGSDRRKLAIAAEVRANTSVSMNWISNRLHLRSAANASQQLRRYASEIHSASA